MKTFVLIMFSDFLELLLALSHFENLSRKYDATLHFSASVFVFKDEFDFNQRSGFTSGLKPICWRGYCLREMTGG